MRADPYADRFEMRFEDVILVQSVAKWDAAKHPRDKEGQFAQIGSVTVEGRDITVVKPKRAMRDTLVLIDVARFDAEFAKDRNFYLSEGGGPNAIGNRYAQFGKFLADQPQLPSMEASEVYIQPDGGVGFTNGRHRYAWLRDHGVTAIPVALEWDSLLNAKKHGYLATKSEAQAQITQARKDFEQPEWFSPGEHTMQRVVWDTKAGDTIELAKPGELSLDGPYDQLGAVHVGDPEFWGKQLIEDYGRDESMRTINIRTDSTDVLADDVQYGIPDESGEKGDSWILITKRKKLQYGRDWVFDGEEFTQKWDEAEHPRDKEGQFVEMYHGTVESNLGSIAEQGLQTKYSGQIWPEFSKPDQVYLSVDEYGAVEWAGKTALRAGGEARPVVVKVKIPADQASKLTKDPRFEDDAEDINKDVNRQFRGSIPPEWITEVRRTDDPRDEEWKEFRKKWDESLHPRDKEGQFARSGTVRQPGDEAVSMEGAGPERKKWEDLNLKASAAQDVYIDHLTRHRDFVKSLNKKYGTSNVLDYPEEGYKEYKASQALRDAAGEESNKYEDALKAQTPIMKVEVVTNLATAEAAKLGIPPWRIEVVDKTPPEFRVGNKVFTEGGHFSPDDERIEINVRDLSYGDAHAVRGMVAHESSHFVYHTLKAVADQEFKKYLAKAYDAKDILTPWYHERFQVDPMDTNYYSRQVRPEKIAEMMAEFPASSVLAELAGGKANIFKGLATSMVKENGHSAYAKSYWTQEAIKDKGGYESAINETMAEVTRFLSQPESWHEDQQPNMSSPWVQLTAEMHRWYKERRARIDAAVYHAPDAQGRKYGEPGYQS